jgi:formamidopyrimidine-DNA glycosylase
MPELPEVETTVNGIKPWLESKTIDHINIYNPSLRWLIPTDLPKKHLNQKIIKVERRAKYILIHLESQSTLILHLGMSGSLRILTSNKELQKHDHFELITNDGVILRFNDPRRFGCVLDSDNFIEHKLIKNLGPEPLTKDLDGRYLKLKSTNKTKAVKNFIMDNHIVVGVGNIYASEALFMAGISPLKPAGKVSLIKYTLLAEKIKQVLSLAIQAGGTTLKDFINSDGKPGYFSQQLKVYARKNQPCKSCNHPIKQITQGQRSTFYCSKCQK